MRATLTAGGLLFLSLLALPAAGPPPAPYNPKIAPASDEWMKARAAVKLPAGMTMDLWAGEPLLAHPVAFAFDNKGRAFVAESFRIKRGVDDIRGFMSWLDDDLACRTVADRVAMTRKHLGKKADSWAVHHERVRLVEDTKGAGRADKSTVFADGFKSLESGIAAGVLPRGDGVYYTCIPDLWHLRDTKGTGKADVRRSLHTGYGIHMGFYGHDLHGLILGPDGRLYFSIGDRGLNVKTKGAHHCHPDTGCVLRCNPDGSELEVFATGLRNPQELAFDQHGNLFTGDNNSDGGDKARVVYLVEGGDSGWRIGYQFPGTAQSNRGPWNAEKLWHPPFEGQAAWVIPPVAHLGDGPSGLAYYPGTGMPDKYKGHFFLADFRGDPTTSGIRAFKVNPGGAGFEMVGAHQPIWGVLATDVEFAPDGALYISDWVAGWGLTGKGRLWKVTDAQASKAAVVAEVKRLLGEGMAKRPLDELSKLLGHANMKVRLEAQWELAARPKGREALALIASGSKEPLARLHAVWGLGQCYRVRGGDWASVLALAEDKDAEVRAQVARVLGDGKAKAGAKALIAMLKDDEPRVRFLAAQALARVPTVDAVAPLVALAGDNADRDVYVRHAAARALAACGDDKALLAAAKGASVPVRRALVLALRHRKSEAIAAFLADSDAGVVLEAARAINDVPIDAATAKLAAVVTRRGLDDALAYRALNANFRLGTAGHARAVARFAARSDAAEGPRVEALRLLEMWASPPGRDRIMGTWRPLKPRDAAIAVRAIQPEIGGIFAGPNAVRKQAAKVAAALGIKEVGPALHTLLADAKRPAEARVEALRALATLKDKKLDEAVTLAIASAAPALRAEGRRVLAVRKPAEGLTALQKAIASGTTLEKQQAYDVLGTLTGDKPAALVARGLDELLAGKLAGEVHLDVIEAAQRHGKAPAVAAKLAAYAKRRDKAELGAWQASLLGGDAEAGRRLFLYRTELSCLRCHKADGEGAGEVGPDLTGIGSRQKREYLLEAIVSPSKQIAKGYESVELTLTNGQIKTGVLRGETKAELKLVTAEGATITVPVAQIEERRTGKSAMPEDLVKHLSRRDMRDLVEYLAGLKEKKAP